MRSVVLAAIGALVVAQMPAFNDDFSSYDSSRWLEQTDIEHCSDGACFLARPDHLSFGAGGLTSRMDQSPCNQSSTACCVGGTCADWACGHMRTAGSLLYGAWNVTARIAHDPAGRGPTPTNAFTCFGVYVSQPEHNEISICFEGTDQTTAGFAYWYNANEHKTSVALGFDASANFHTYGVVWAKDSITWSVDGRVLHVDKGTAGKTIPYEPCQMDLIVRPRSAPYLGDAALSVSRVSYAP